MSSQIKSFHNRIKYRDIKDEVWANLQQLNAKEATEHHQSIEGAQSII
jgi:hypothetical protein